MSSVSTLEENAARTLKRTPCRFYNPKFWASMAYTIRKIKRKTGIVFSAIIKNHRGEHLKSKSFQRKGDAETWAKRIEADAEKKESLGLSGAGMTFADILDEYLYQWKGKDPSHGVRLAHWRTELGSYKIPDISTALIRQKLKEFQNGKCKRGNGKGKTALLPKTRAPATVVRYRNILSGVFRYAIQEGYTLTNPVSKAPCPTVDNKRVRYLSDDERDRLFEACKASAWPRLYPLILLATCTGMRKSEMLNLKWRDIDFEQGLAFLATTKNGEPRITPIPTPALNELKKMRGVGTALVFPSDIKPEQPMNFKKHWYKALDQVGVENFRFHDLRHTAASYLVMQGAGLHETAEILGHKDLSTTQVLGTFGSVNLDVTSPELGKNTARARELFELESLVRKFGKPDWPEAILGPIDQGKAFRGRMLYIQSQNGQESCDSCHALPDSDGNYPETSPSENLFGQTFVKTHMVALADIRTDPLMATNFATRKVSPGPLGALLPPPYDTMPLVPAPVLLSAGVSISSQYSLAAALPPFDQAETYELIDYRVTNNGTSYRPPNLLAYRVRPLEGVWATAPFLHNGSVPTLYDLLLPPCKRSKVFYVGNQEFDTEKVGFKSEKRPGLFKYDTRVPGNLNSGHLYGIDLDDDQRSDLLEFLKTL